MSHRTLRVLVVAAIAALAVPVLAQNQGGGGGSGNAPRQSARASASAQPRASATAGQRIQAGTQLRSSKRAPNRLTLGSTLAGSKLANGSHTATNPAPGLGSKLAGSKLANGTHTAANPAPGLGSKVAGSQLRNPGSNVAQRAGLGSAIAGSQVGQAQNVPHAGLPQMAPTNAPSGRFRSIVPALQGRVPAVSTNNPGFVAFMVDVSDSMNQHIAGAAGVTKADAAAEAANNTIMEFVLAHRGGGGDVRNRLQIAQLNYGSQVTAGLGADVVGLADLANNPTDFITAQDGNGQPTQLPIWLRPQASGSTHMRAAFSKMRGVFASYLQRAGGAASPERPRLMLGFNITDGQPTDGDPSGELEHLAQEAAAAGNQFIMTNIHVSENPNAVPVLFPTEEQAAGFDDYGKALFEMSSPVPDALMPLVRELNPAAATGTGARMMAVNANLDGLNSVIQVGSSLAATGAAAAPAPATQAAPQQQP